MLQTGAQKNYIKEETLERLKVDEEVLGEFFRDVLNPAVCFLLPYILIYIQNWELVKSVGSSSQLMTAIHDECDALVLYE
jgi:hypothetical protein